MNNVCPRCRSRTLVARCGGGVECLACDYGEQEDLSLYADVMAAMPGRPMVNESRLDRYGNEIYRRDHRERRAHDQWLAEEAAARHGVSLEQLQVKLNWKVTHPSIRFALQSVIADLTISGLGIQRIAEVLNKHSRTISKSPGLAKGRAMREKDG